MATKITKSITSYAMCEQRNAQSGRSMTETLGVLALIGVLTIVAVAGIKFAGDKMKANTIINDSKMVFVDVQKEKTAPLIDSFRVPDVNIESDKQMQIYTDFLGKHYIFVEGIEEGVCNRMLDMRSEGILDFYTVGSAPYMDCVEANDILIDWNGDGAPAQCLEFSECDVGDVCDADYQCATCESPKIANTDKTACICNAEESVPCILDDKEWCCTGELVCGDKVDECVPSDGMCVYTVGQIDPSAHVRASCAYTVDKVSETIQKASCSYTVSDLTNEVVIDTRTFYDVTVSGSASQCASDEYCMLLWKDTDGADDGEWALTKNTPADASITGTIWGECQPSNTFDSDIKLAAIAQNVGVTEKEGCDDPDMYCMLLWKDIDGADDGEWALTKNTPADASITGTIWGECQPSNTFDSNIKLAAIEQNVNVIPVKHCPSNMYCYLNWKTNDACTIAGSNIEDKIYGVCTLPEDTGEKNCPYGE